MPIISLVSGGIDSMVMAKVIDRQGEEQIPLFIDYGQLARDREWRACRRLMRPLGLPIPVRIDVEGYGKAIPSGITDPGKDTNKDAFLPGRNLLLLVIASSYAHSKGIDKVAIGLLSEQHLLFPDQRESFVVNTNFAVNSALDDDITILTPLINFTKNDIFRLAQHYKLPLDKTYSCHSGNQEYCGQCVACNELIKTGGKRYLPQLKRKR